MNNNSRNTDNTTPTYTERAWLRARRCGPNGGNCVELNYSHRGRVGVRDSKGKLILNFRRRGWITFLAQVTG